jgi:hypothetical protein
VSSRLQHSEKLGRRIRTGDSAVLGIPTEELAVEALAAGNAALAREYLDYEVEEVWRVQLLFSTWLRALLRYGERSVQEFPAERARLAEVLEGEPPLLDAAGTVGAHDRVAAERAAAAGDVAAFKRKVAALREAQVGVHDRQADWCWGLLTVFFNQLGEDRMEEVFRETQADWLAERYRAIAQLTPRESFELTIEGMRAHFCGAGRTGRIEVKEHDDRWVMSFDPCGSGGVMRRGEPERGKRSRAQAPYSFAHTTRGHDWSWGRTGVCVYCAHCAVVNEILPIEQLGTPMRVTDHPESPGDPCRWTVYKSPELVPDSVFARVGRERRRT